MSPNNQRRMLEAVGLARAGSFGYEYYESAAATRPLVSFVKQLIEAKAIIHQYEQLGFDVPKSMTEAVETLTRQAKTAYRAELEASLAAAKKKAEELKSREIKREETEKEIERLKALLG